MTDVRAGVGLFDNSIHLPHCVLHTVDLGMTSYMLQWLPALILADCRQNRKTFRKSIRKINDTMGGIIYTMAGKQDEEAGASRPAVLSYTFATAAQKRDLFQHLVQALRCLNAPENNLPVFLLYENVIDRLKAKSLSESSVAQLLAADMRSMLHIFQQLFAPYQPAGFKFPVQHCMLHLVQDRRHYGAVDVTSTELR